MREWHEVEPKPYSPCDGCQIGFGDISQKIVDGVLYEKVDTCDETCERLNGGREPPMVDTSWVLTPSGYKKRTFI